MAGGTSSHSEDEITGINITPLVDIMLVLLIIFMVTANFVSHKSINVELPKAASGEDAKKARTIGIVLDKDSNLYVDGVKIAFGDFAAKIEEYKSRQLDLSGLIDADKATPHGTVIKAIDILRVAGIEKFSLNIDPEVSK